MSEWRHEDIRCLFKYGLGILSLLLVTSFTLKLVGTCISQLFPGLPPVGDFDTTRHLGLYKKEE